MTESLRSRIYRIVETDESGNPIGKMFDTFMIVLIVTNVTAVVLESVPSLAAEYGVFFVNFDIFSIVVFTAEYATRVWVADEDPIYARYGPVLGRLRYMTSLMALIDLLAILPFYLGFFIDLDLRFMRVFRLLRLLKLTRYSSALETVGVVLMNHWRQLAASLVIMLTLLVFASSIAYLFEHKAQPEIFGSIPDAMWWGFATLTTVG